MDNYIIIAVIAVIAFVAIRTMIKRASRKGCCGSASDYTPKKKKLKNIIATKEFVIDGMHCEKCSGRVMETLNDIPGVAGVVSHKTGIAAVSYEREVPDEQIKAKIERLGYTVTQIR